MIVVLDTNSHFNTLIGSGFKPQPIKPNEFIAQVLKL